MSSNQKSEKKTCGIAKRGVGIKQG